MGTQLSKAERDKRAVIDTLGALGAAAVQDDSLTFSGNKIILPEQYSGKVVEAIKYLMDYQKQMETVTSFNRTFRFRPQDGAHAFDASMRKLFGSAGIGVTIKTMFGNIPPQMITIDIGVGKTMQVPWGEIRLDQLEATFQLGSVRDAEYGHLFHLSIEGPRKYKAHYEAFFQVVQVELETNSIYKGKAVDGGKVPSFLDTTKTDPDRVYYAQAVMDQMQANVFAVLDHTAKFREMNMPLKRSVLLEGPYGTGKTLFGTLTAQRAVKNGWTFILCRPGKDNLEEVLQTAQLYAPAVVWFEDIETQAGVDEMGNSLGVSKVLDMLDGAQSKSAEIMACFTTNHVKRLQKAVLRPGRLDSIIHVEHLDEQGFAKLITQTLPPGALDNKVDMAAVSKAFTGYLPSFAVEAVRRAARYNLVRTSGKGSRITTEDLVKAADDLRVQHDLMDQASETKKRVPFEEAFKGVIGETLSKTAVLDRDGDHMWDLHATVE